MDYSIFLWHSYNEQREKTGWNGSLADRVAAAERVGQDSVAAGVGRAGQESVAAGGVGRVGQDSVAAGVGRAGQESVAAGGVGRAGQGSVTAGVWKRSQATDAGKAGRSAAEAAMAQAIQETLTSVLGSSITTVAGFIALCFMTFTMGRDLGVVMAKGVLFGVLGCVTVLPSLILLLDKPLQKTKHRSLIPRTERFARGVVKFFPVFLAVFLALVVPAYYGYGRTNGEVYYDMGECLPEDMEYVAANSRLQEEFNIASTHMLLIDTALPSRDIRRMIKEMEQVDGVKYVLGLESFIGPMVPEEILPKAVREVLKSGKWELMLINSEYRVASDEVNVQVDQLNGILKKYDESGMLIGEAPCMKDMIETTDRDFKVVNTISILAIFIIIALVEKSISLPFILISVIELAIFINLGLPHYLGQRLPFIAPICISTIQLGATVDYAILMTTRYKEERTGGLDKKKAVGIALASSVPSVVVSGMGLFAATFGVALYSDIDIISSMCMLMARGAVVSMLSVLFILPSLLLLCDRMICATTAGMREKAKTEKRRTEAAVS
ncbi:MAG: MMPL family transporter [Lachnospiraceae bacterium]|nr:MMPL family transporter [Lachnospiraceae bacterium]